MNKTEASILRGLEDAIAFAEGDESRGKKHFIEVPTVDVSAARKKLGFTQEKFAKTFGVSPATIRQWEQGRRQPSGAARVLLNVIDKNPDAVFRAIH